MNIHFVCSGNSYRSRLAEAYLKSKKIPGITVSSSGTIADSSRIGNGPICWYAMRLMKKFNLIEYMSWQQNQTTEEILKNVNLLICMRKEHLDYCKSAGYAGESEVWNIPDLNELDGFIPFSVPGIETDINHITLTEQTYNLIVNKVDELAGRIK